MGRLIDWFRSWVKAASALRGEFANVRDQDAVDARIASIGEKLDERAASFERESERMSDALKESRDIIRQQANALEELRAENKVMKIEVTNLAAAYKRQLQRYDAETAIEVRKQTAASIPGREEIIE